MAKFWSRIPIIGKIVEIVKKEPYKERLKNLLRRQFYNAAVASTVLTSVASVVCKIALTGVGVSWDEIDKAIDKLDESDAKTIYLSFAGWNLW